MGASFDISTAPPLISLDEPILFLYPQLIANQLVDRSGKRGVGESNW